MGLVLAYNKGNAQPSFTVGAAITGTVESGQTLTCTYTVVRAKASNVTVRWYSHANIGGTPLLIGTGATVVLTGTEVGQYIRAIVTAINPAGTVQSTSDYTAAVAANTPPEPPTVASAAVITGTANVDGTLTVTASFNNASSVTYQWYSFLTEPTGNPLVPDANTVTLGTDDEQALTASEAGRWIGVNVTGTNAVSTAVTSAKVAMVGVDPWDPVAPAEYAVPAYDLTGMTAVYCNVGDDLQAKINSLVPGQYLVVAAGETWTGNFYFPNTKANGTGWIYVISSAIASLPEGTRVTSADAVHMPKIVAGTRTSTAMHVYRGVQKVRFVGVEFTTAYDARDNVQYTILPLGLNTHGTGNIDELIFDRCYVHGTATGNNRDGINTYAAVKNLAIVECEVSDFHGVGYESHALHLYQGQGPMLIRNSRFEAAAIPVFIGDNTSFGTPKNITFIGNYCTKQAKWYSGDPSYAGIAWLNKNVFEIKYGERIRIEGNIFENSWAVGTPGGLIITAIGDVVTDVTIKNNVIRNIQLGAAMLLSATGSFAVSRSTLDRVRVENNLIYNCARTLIGVTGSGSKPVNYARVLHNTATHTTVRPSTSSWIGFNQTNSTDASANNIDIRDNCYTAGVYHVTTNGVAGDTTGLGIRCDGEWYYRHNMAIEAAWPYDTWFDDNNANVYGHINVASRTSAKFANVSLAGPSDFVLAADSPGHAAGTDGEDVGCDIPALLAAIAAVNDTTP